MGSRKNAIEKQSVIYKIIGDKSCVSGRLSIAGYTFNDMRMKNNIQMWTVMIGIALITSCSNEQKSADVASTEAVTDKRRTAPHADKLNVLSAEEKASGWQLLFDGVSTDGWHSFQKNTVEGWQVADGMLFTAGKNGDIVTNKEYENFEFTAEWKIEEQGNSGIFFYVVESPQYKRTYETGPEFQIIDDKNYPQKLKDSQKTGANSDVQAPTMFPSNKPGEWNTTRILVNRGHVEHWLNGHKILEYEFDSPEWKKLVAESKFSSLDYAKIRKGHIAFQDHGGPVAYRNIKIREL